MQPSRGAAEAATDDRATPASPASREVAFTHERADNMLITLPRLKIYPPNKSKCVPQVSTAMLRARVGLYICS